MNGEDAHILVAAEMGWLDDERTLDKALSPSNVQALISSPTCLGKEYRRASRKT
jgi:hypothetical protein